MSVPLIVMYAGFVLLGMVLDAAVLRIGRSRPMIAVCWYGFWTVAATVVAAIEAARGEWGWAAWMAFCAANAGWRCRQHWNRRKRKRAAALVGAKSRARIAALVRKMQLTAR